MKTKLLFCLFILAANSLFSQGYYQFFDGNDTSAFSSLFPVFDTSTSNIWQIGEPSKVIFDSAFSNPNAILTDTVNNYPSGDTSRFQFNINPNPFGIPAGILAMRWAQKLDMKENRDGGIIEYSVDTGASWKNVFTDPYVYAFYGFNSSNAMTVAGWQDGFSGTDSSWKDIWLCFDQSFLTTLDTIQIRFTFLSGQNAGSHEGWMMDNFILHNTFIHTVDEEKQEEYMRVYPTATSDLLEIRTQKQKGFHIIENIHIYDHLGRLAKSYGTCPTKFTLSLADLPKGHYIVKIQTNLRTEDFPVIITD